MSMSALPSISIVVPNFNGARTLERALRSILDQQYPKLELLVADGASSDGSVDILRQYAPRLAWWCSEKDKGQSDAINKGLTRATGEVVNWLGSDDTLEPGSLAAIGRYFAEDPKLDVLVGRCRWHNTQTGKGNVDTPVMRAIEALPAGVPFSQPSCFFRRRILRADHPVDESYHYCMDIELWAYFKSKNVTWKIVDDCLSTFEMSGENKTSTGAEKIVAEMERVYLSYAHDRIPMTWWLRRLAYPLDKWRGRHPGKLTQLAVKGMKLAIYSVLSPFYGWNRLRAMNYSSLVPTQGNNAR
jgi:glycosyltransferase involved in cell wall biosynthesis